MRGNNARRARLTAGSDRALISLLYGGSSATIQQLSSLVVEGLDATLLAVSSTSSHALVAAVRDCGFPATIVVGKLGEKIGPKRAVYVCIGVYCAVTIGGYFMQQPHHFYYLAATIGLAQGGIAAVGQLQLLQPFFGLALAVALLRESVSATMLAATFGVILCIAAARRFAR